LERGPNLQRIITHASALKGSFLSDWGLYGLCRGSRDEPLHRLRATFAQVVGFGHIWCKNLCKVEEPPGPEGPLKDG
jgi:hypothetical protein